MTRQKKLASIVTASIALAALLTPSAFAENRHRNGTGSRGNDGSIHRDSGRQQSEQRSSRSVDRNRSSEQRSSRNFDRNRDRSSEQRSSRDFDRNRDRSRDRSSEERSSRSFDRNRDRSSEQRSSRDWDRNRNRSNDRRADRDRSRQIDGPRTDRTWAPSSRYTVRDGWRGERSDRHFGRQPYWASGRVRHFEPWRGGYRVWIGGVTYPFWVPLSYYSRYPFRVGLSIRLGGYYNSLGYYEYYDGYSDGFRSRLYNDSYRDRTIAAGTLRGVVESVDYSRGTFILRNDATDNLVTIATRDRYVDEMRAGDIIEVEGDWTRSGLFEADRVDLIDRRNDDGYRNDRR